MNTSEIELSSINKITVVGLGYVGLPLAIEFSKKFQVVGLDINENKIEQLISGIDQTNEVGSDKLRASKVKFTSDSNELKNSNFIVVAVPTPIYEDHTPNLEPLESASKLIGLHLSKGAIVVYESTVYPGVTEEVCVPILEEFSKLKCGVDFFVGYSPERINPGDKVHSLRNITKIVSGMNNDVLEIIASTYEQIIDAGVYRAESIRVAEAAKVIENSQRDINIAFVNELSIIFEKMGINTQSVLNAAKTKWNFLDFKPGLVGGHCIGVDPYYLTYKAEQLGYHSQVILAGRRINDSMGKHVAESVVKQLLKTGYSMDTVKIDIFGFTFKENCPDTRNTRVIDIINELTEYGITPRVFDSYANRDEVANEYNLTLSCENKTKADVIIFAVAHSDYQNYSLDKLKNLFSKSSNLPGLLFDVKGIFKNLSFEDTNIKYWSL